MTGRSAMPQGRELKSADEDRIWQRCRELVVCGSIEMGAKRPEDARELAKLLPSRTPVFVTHLPRYALCDTLDTLVSVSSSGLEPVPHLAARRIGSRTEVREFLLEAVRRAGVRRVLVIGGDSPNAAGPYPDAGSLLSDGVLVEAGVREVAFAAHPEGLPRVATPVLLQALTNKIGMARRLGLGCSVVTQFCFNPGRIIELIVDIERRAPDVPVYCGLAGPTTYASLLKFAQICGVSASLRALMAQGIGAARLVTHTDPTDQLFALARHAVLCPSNNIAGAHVFSFGAAMPAARWMNGIMCGEPASSRSPVEA